MKTKDTYWIRNLTVALLVLCLAEYLETRHFDNIEILAQGDSHE